MEAFFDRGIKDIYASHDLEDIVYLFNYSTNISRQILTAPTEVKTYLVQRLTKLINNNTIISAMRGSLYYEQADERMLIIQERIQTIIQSV